MEHKIGETFCLEDGTKLEIVRSVCNCRDCYFFNSINNYCSRPKNVESCSSFTREDEKFIIFKQVKDNNMEEKRSIKISLEEAKEWYNSGDSFKKELALKAYKEIELSINNYPDILALLENETIANNTEKAEVYGKLLNIAKYYNSIYPIKYDSHLHTQLYYIITKENISVLFMKYKGFSINRSVCKSEYEIAFNSPKAAKQAIDILGDELNILFE